MAYNTPELLLVGAAQNLVLANGSHVLVGKRVCDDILEQEDFDVLYDRPGLW